MKLTLEMIEAFGQARSERHGSPIHTHEWDEAGLAAVLAIVERDYSVHRRSIAEEIASLPKPPRRLKACVENWPEAETSSFNPLCCRWPKSCSATRYDPASVTDDDLEPER